MKKKLFWIGGISAVLLVALAGFGLSLSQPEHEVVTMLKSLDPIEVNEKDDIVSYKYSFFSLATSNHPPLSWKRVTDGLKAHGFAPDSGAIPGFQETWRRGREWVKLSHSGFKIVRFTGPGRGTTAAIRIRTSLSTGSRGTIMVTPGEPSIAVDTYLERSWVDRAKGWVGSLFKKETKAP